MKRKPSVLIIDDDKILLRLLEINLEAEGYKVIPAASAKAGYHALLTWKPDVLLLDVMLPDTDGFRLCEQVRQFSDIPIIFLTARKDEEVLVMGLDIGADDFIVKPFRREVLLARLRAVLRRTGFSASEECITDVVRGIFQLNCSEHRLVFDSKNIKLSHTEFRLLYFLITNANRVLSNEELTSKVWGAELAGDTESLRTYIRYLRQKIENEPNKPEYIVTERGIGYRFKV